MKQQSGALVISLDFELHWGVRDQFAFRENYTKHLEGARTVTPKLLRMFHDYDVAATWATVGFLFARSKSELESFFPPIKPDYKNKDLDPYAETFGKDEQGEPLHYAASLIQQILETPKQELSTHTFCHYYCLEEGQTAEAFRADLESAIAIAKTWNLELKSIIFPRNQLNPSYNSILHDLGIKIYRGNETGYMYQAAATAEQTPLRRGLRLADTYLPITNHHLGNWHQLEEASGLINVPSSRVLRAYNPKLKVLESLRLARIKSGMTMAANQHKLYHLWWHPHNFGIYQEENLAFLESILQHFQALQERYGMQSLSMLAVAEQLKKEAS